MAQSGGDSFSSTLTDGKECLESTVADETDRLMSILVDGTDRLMTSLVDGTDRLKSTLVDGMGRLRSNLVDGTDSLRPSLVDETDRLRSSLVEGMDRLKSSLVEGTDILRPFLPCESNSFRTESGHDYMFENCCGLCEREQLQKEAVGFCVDCKDYLCTECFRHHTKPRPLRHHSLLGQQEMPRKTHMQHVMDIDIRSQCVYGCVVLPGDKLVVLDDNCIVKLIDLTNNSIVAQLELPHTFVNVLRKMFLPIIRDITKVSRTQVAVIYNAQNAIHVVIVSVDQLKLDRQIKVNGKCNVIASINENLVVSYYDPAKVEIINMAGQVLQTVVTEEKGRGLFHSYTRSHVAVSNNHQTIYISDYHGNTVTSVDLSGQVLATYEGDMLRPYGLTVDRAGRVYVCSKYSDTILLLTGRLTEIQKLPLPSEGDGWPSSVCYCKATNRLYIGTYSRGIRVYQLE